MSQILEPDRPIIDAHHHLFVRPTRHYLADDFASDLATGHRIIGTIFVEAGAYHRQDGPEWLRPIGEVEFANGVAAMAAGGYFGGCRVAAGIIGHADLRLGDDTARLLDRCIAAVPDRYRGVRQLVVDHPADSAFRYMTHRPPSGVLQSTAFREGFRHLAPRGLTFDMGVYHVQFTDLAKIADAFPDTTIVIDHMGMVMGLDHDDAGRSELRKAWAAGLHELGRRPNIMCKVGGLGMPVWGFGLETRAVKAALEDFVDLWRPYIETAISAFGVDRCMFESNFPIDAISCDYAMVWNVFKTIAAGCSDQEKQWLFHDTALRTYRLSAPSDFPADKG